MNEHKHSLRLGYLEKSKLAKHVFEEDHKIDWDNAKVLTTESDSRYRKYKESAHIVLSDNPISQPSLDKCPIWFSVIRNEITSSENRSKQLCMGLHLS
jgi:hypothetical protein